MTYSELFATLARVQPTLPGWCSVEKTACLASLVLSTHPEVVVEIGVWGGSSAFPLALSLKYVGMGTLIAIDPWERLAAVANQTTSEDRAHWDKQNYEAVYNNFMALLKSFQLDDIVRVERKKSDTVQPPNVIHLLHVDGGHDDSAVRDCARFCPRVSLGGYAVLDDLDWTGGAVRRAEQFILQRGFQKLYEVDKAGVYQRVR